MVRFSDPTDMDAGSGHPTHPFSEEGEGHKVKPTGEYSVIALDKFIQATRDSGYKGTVSAISELVDNSLQALARTISIFIRRSDEETEHSIVIAVLDNGHGMDAHTLRQSLRFGGSSRFDDRSGLGRYGMGLPNASLSQARRVEVYSWLEPGKTLFTYLDLEEIVSGETSRVPSPRRTRLPLWAQTTETSSGTLVVWSQCDRLENRRISTLEQKLKLALGRVFRYFLWDGVEIDVNGDQIIPVDPLYVRQPSVTAGGEVFAEPLEYEVRAPVPSAKASTGIVTVTFSELPIEDWHSLPNDEKRRLGITNGAGVSIVRGGREIDYGWFFLADKRRENYDDWWRAEIRFEPELDELFGITHTKQQVRPQESLIEVLSPDMGDMARALNARVRQTHLALKTRVQARSAETLAAGKDHHLREIRHRALPEEHQQMAQRLRRRHASLRETSPTAGNRDYRIVEDDLGESSFIFPIFDDGRITLVVNPKHRFYKQVYRPLLEGDSRKPEETLLAMQLLLLSAVRAEIAATSAAERKVIANFRREWSEVLDVLLKP
ncbi:MAG TPA: ATP-binding protein [Thermoanaerobaculia bacterium]|nr:ATP-binding protein [Thermoanaerobaculia bacterium]